MREFPKACSTRLLGALGAIEFQSRQGSKPPTMYNDPVFQTNRFLLFDWFRMEQLDTVQPWWNSETASLFKTWLSFSHSWSYNFCKYIVSIITGHLWKWLSFVTSRYRKYRIFVSRNPWDIGITTCQQKQVELNSQADLKFDGWKTTLQLWQGLL